MTDHSPPTDHFRGTVAQHCYRHPDRSAGVSCQRCARPICPSCMITASVGFQCPDCARAGAAASRTIRPLSGPSEPVVTYALIALNVAVFVAGVLGGGSMTGGSELSTRFALSTTLVADGEWWRLVTSGFIHYGMLHLAFNMYALYALGGAIERAVGRVQFALIYFVSMLGGSFLVSALSGPFDQTAGASGAVFGIFGAFAALQLSRGINPMQTGIGTTILLNLVITFAVPGISIGGHLGGLLAGGACGAVLFGLSPQQARGRARSTALAIPLLGGLGVVLFFAGVGMALARTGV